MRCCIKFDFCMNRAEFDELVFSLTDDEREVLDMRAAFLEDKDAPEDKAGRYYHNIAAVQE